MSKAILMGWDTTIKHVSSELHSKDNAASVLMVIVLSHPILGHRIELTCIFAISRWGNMKERLLWTEKGTPRSDNEILSRLKDLSRQ